jgi:hypothetical protein
LYAREAGLSRKKLSIAQKNPERKREIKFLSKGRQKVFPFEKEFDIILCTYLKAGGSPVK